MKKYFARLTFIILSVFFASQFCFAQIPIEAEEYAVHGALIKKVCGDSAKLRLVIGKETASDPIEAETWKFLNKRLSPLDADFVKDYNERNNSRSELQNQFNLKSEVTLLSETEFRVIFKPERDSDKENEEEWETFRKQYQASSIMSLSRVGFNRNRNKALVEFGDQWASLGGEGHFYLLVKKNNQWRIKKKVISWVS